MSSNPLVEMVYENRADLASLGLLFLRLLHADMNVLSATPSPTLAMVFTLEQNGVLPLDKNLLNLFSELERTGIEPLTDGFGQSILRS